jgi:hypothetical protein
MSNRVRSSLWPVVTPMFITAMVLFVFTIAVGILNGTDVYLPDHDTLMTHVHAGTLGFITLSVAGAAMLIFTEGLDLTDDDVRRARTLSWTLVIAIVLYVIAFGLGGHIPGDRIQRPIFGTVLFIVVLWFGTWLYRRNGVHGASSVVRLGILLAWVSLIVGATLGVLLGVFSARGEVPGLSDSAAAALADAHPPSMVIGFLILAAVSITEWLIRTPRPYREDRWGVAQMLIVFSAGILVIIALVGEIDPLLGPANLMEILAVGILLVRLRREMAPSGWRDAGTSAFGRVSILFLIADLAVLTYLVSQVVSDSLDFDALTDAQFGLLLTLDHLMFVGVMAVAIFGVIARCAHADELSVVDRIVLWGVAIGIIGFGIGLMTVTPAIKRVSTPVLGLALLIGIGSYIGELWRDTHTPA